MDKKDVLDKARTEQAEILKRVKKPRLDEREEQLRLKANSLSSISTIILVAFFYIFRTMRGDFFRDDLMMICTLQVVVASFYHYFSDKKASWLVAGIASTVSFLMFTWMYLTHYGVL